MTALPPSKDPKDYIVHDSDPLNAEPKPFKLIDDGFTTSKEHAYLRNHGDILHINKENYKLHLEVEDTFHDSFDAGAPLSESLKNASIDLDTLLGLGRTNLAAALQCAGNRRDDMNERKETEGIAWGPATILNADWSGILLRDLYFNLGMRKDYEKVEKLSNAHIHFTSKQECQQAEEYQASIPLVDALEESRSLLLADRMNGEDLPDEHGGPLRLIAPGFIGARSVKWLYSISIRSKPSTNFYMTSDYKVLPSWVGSADKSEWMKSVEPLQQTGLQSEIGKVEQTSPREYSKINIAGYAFNGSGVPIKKVQVHVMIDEEEEGDPEELVKTAIKQGEWLDAELEQESKPKGEKVFSWTLFAVSANVQEEWKGRRLSILCRAEDANGKQQKPLANWNIRGIGEESYGHYRNFHCH